MDSNFWQKKWETKDIGFHQAQANPLLVKHFNRLALAEGSRIFLPLCGKTLDIAWLLSQGCKVVGAELSELAVKELFAELGMPATIKKVGKLIHYSAEDIDVFVGDIFNLSEQMLGAVDAVYDRAALVALPDNVRVKYTALLMQITHKAPQLVICFEYEQRLMAGPPFSITEQEVKQHYSAYYNVTLIESVDVIGGLKGVCKAQEKAWLLCHNKID